MNMGKGFSLAALCASLALAIAAPALAQSELTPGQAVQGTLSADTPLIGDRRMDCYTLNTTPGSVWQIEMNSSAFDTYLWLGRGEDCANTSATDRRNDDGGQGLNARMEFTAGGGVYLVAAMGFSAQPSGSYTLRATQTGANGRNPLPAGPQMSSFAASVGTASTIPGQPDTQYQPGQTFRDCDNCPPMVVIPAGSFMMGSPPTEAGRTNNEGPRHIVTINRAFAIGQYEVTFDEYDACVAAQACLTVADGGWGRGRRPVINVNYTNAQRYVAYLSAITGMQYFLPSESEWEYAARAGSDTEWNTGSAIITDDANLLNAFGRTVPVGGYPPNAFGLYDTHGNVAELVQDCLDTGYVGAPNDGSAATAGNCSANRIVRGGGFTSEPNGARSASRALAGNRAFNSVGFRVARALTAPGANYHVGQANAHLARNAFDEAIAAADTAVRLEPTNWMALNMSCWARAVANRDLDLALEHCNAAVAGQPGNNSPLDSRAHVYLRRGDFQAARRDFDAAIAANAQIPESHYGRGVARARLGDARGSRRDIETATQLNAASVERMRGYGFTP